MATTTADRPRPANVVVTGASGWLGQNLVRALANERERVRCLVRTHDDAALLSVVGPSIEPIVGDVRDPAVLDRLFDDIGSASVFHAAGVIHPQAKVREMFDVNVGGTQLVLDRARRASAIRFVHVSSNSPFGTNASPGDRFDEDSAFNPYLGYGQSKMEAEQLVQRTFGHGDLETVIVRPPWFYGPYHPARQAQFLSAIRKGRFPLVGDGTQQRSMVFTGNLVHGMLRAEVAAAAPGRAYWIADAEPYELREILDTIKRALAAEGLPVTDKAPRTMPRAGARVAEAVDRFVQARGRYIQSVHVLGELNHTIACDVSRARAEIGYDPQVTLFEGMRTAIRWSLANGDAI
jgi:nucleoside-diphosphate-sugar epimerase